MTSWREEKLDVDRIERMTVPELHERWARPGGVQILDVRERIEWDAGHIPGSVHVPYHDIDALPAGIDPARPVAVICGSGPALGGRRQPAQALRRRATSSTSSTAASPQWAPRGLADRAPREG